MSIFIQLNLRNVLYVIRKDKAVTEARYIDVGRSIREARKEYGLKQKELAETVSMDPQYLNQIRKQDLV